MKKLFAVNTNTGYKAYYVIAASYSEAGDKVIAHILERSDPAIVDPSGSLVGHGEQPEVLEIRLIGDHIIR